jgi:uncharacterized protein YjdB
LRSIPPSSFAAGAILSVLAIVSCGEAQRVTEVDPDLTATVSVTPPSVAVTAQATVSLSVVVKNAEGGILPNRPVAWSSADPSVATVSSDGSVTGIAIGVTTVVATSDGRSGASTVSVTPIPVSSVEVLPSAARISVGDSVQLAAVAKDGNNGLLPGRGVAWSSSHASIARVTAAGLVTAVAAGTAYIIATSEGKSDSSAIDVSERPVASVVVAPATASVNERQSVQLSARTLDANGNVLAGRVVTWASAHLAVATVSAGGLVSGVAPGAASITATAEGITGSATVTVVPTAPLVLNAGADQVVSLGTPAVLNAVVTSATAGPVRMFWSKLSGPGTARFSHDQFSSSFEDGTISEWTAANQWGPGGGQEGGATVSTDRAHSGVYSWKGSNNPALAPPANYSAKVTRWRFDYTEGYYSAWYWLAPDFTVPAGKPTNIFQFKERTSPWDPTWVVNVKKVGGVDVLNLYDWHGRVSYDFPGAVPKGQWFHVAAYQRVSRTAGEIIVWRDGVRLIALKNVNTLGAPTNTSPPYLMWGVGNYAFDGSSVGGILYVDDAAVSNAVTDPRNPSVQFSAPGTYVLRLTASNDQTTLSDTVVVTVR